MRAASPIGVITFLICTCLTPFAQAHWEIGDDYNMHFPQLPSTGPCTYVQADDYHPIADDWQCSFTEAIGKIHFWGGWENQPGTFLHFNIIIRDNVPAGTDGLPYNHPGGIVWDQNFTIEGLHYTVNGPFVEDPNMSWYDPESFSNGCYIKTSTEYYQYNIHIPEHLRFVQQAGQVYWLTVIASSDQDWGWRMTDNHWQARTTYYLHYETWINMTPCIGGRECLPYLPGDIDYNGFVDAIDYSCYIDWLQGGPAPVYEYLAEDFTPPVTPYYPAADVDWICGYQDSDTAWLRQCIFEGGELGFCVPFYWSDERLDMAFVIDIDNSTPTPLAVPSLTQYGAAVLLLLLITSGTFFVLKKRRALMRHS